MDRVGQKQSACIGRLSRTLGRLSPASSCGAARQKSRWPRRQPPPGIGVPTPKEPTARRDAASDGRDSTPRGGSVPSMQVTA
eukprot:scaffold15978_cov103-Isochrysis_galbana.AAC.10